MQSLPIYKLIPHRRYPSSSIKKSIDCIRSYLERDSFVPDAIIGHFANPQMEIVSKLGCIYKNAKPVSYNILIILFNLKRIILFPINVY